MRRLARRLSMWSVVLHGIFIACISLAHASHLGIRASIAEHARELAEQALAHEHGEGVPHDPEHAAVLYCESARLGDVEAMVALGWMYANGRGIPRNDAYAGTLFRMAAQNGNEYAQRMLRFTGSGGESMPSCLKTPPALFADSPSHLEERISTLAPDRQEIARLVVELASDYEISPSFALAIAITESALNPRAVSPKNAMGVMQLIPGTAARFKVRDVFDPADNIRGGLAYLRWLLAYFEGDTLLAAAAYNAGERAVERYQGVPPFRETRAYVERIAQFISYRHHPFDADLVAPSEILSALKLARSKEDGS